MRKRIRLWLIKKLKAIPEENLLKQNIEVVKDVKDIAIHEAAYFVRNDTGKPVPEDRINEILYYQMANILKENNAGIISTEDNPYNPIRKYVLTLRAVKE